MNWEIGFGPDKRKVDAIQDSAFESISGLGRKRESVLSTADNPTGETAYGDWCVGNALDDCAQRFGTAGRDGRVSCILPQANGTR